MTNNRKLASWEYVCGSHPPLWSQYIRSAAAAQWVHDASDTEETETDRRVPLVKSPCDATAASAEIPSAGACTSGHLLRRHPHRIELVGLSVPGEGYVRTSSLSGRTH